MRDWVFISYETKDGLNLARLAKMRLGLCGHHGWVWQDDKEIGVYTRGEIANNIVEFDHFLLICTRRSLASGPQEWEGEVAGKYQKRPVVIAFRHQHVFPALSVENLILTTNVNFQRACDEAGAVFCARGKLRLEAVEGSEGQAVVEPVAISEGGIEQLEPA